MTGRVMLSVDGLPAQHNDDKAVSGRISVALHDNHQVKVRLEMGDEKMEVNIIETEWTQLVDFLEQQAKRKVQATAPNPEVVGSKGGSIEWSPTKPHP